MFQIVMHLLAILQFIIFDLYQGSKDICFLQIIEKLFKNPNIWCNYRDSNDRNNYFNGVAYRYRIYYIGINL